MGRRLCIAAALALATAAVHGWMDTSATTESGGLHVPDPRRARLSSLGFEPLVADYYWVQALQLVGGTGGAVEEYSDTIAALIDVVTTLDPWVGYPYRFAAIWLTDNEERVRFANELLEQGIAYHPDDWRNRFYLGFNHFYYLDDFATAADVLEEAIALEGAPVYLKRLVARIRANTDSLETAAAFLAELAAAAPDKRSRRQYEAALREVETERRARLLDEAREDYGRRWGRDIEAVSDLVRGRRAVLRDLPPEPNGERWEIDEDSGRIVSSAYGHRYEPHLDAARRARDAEWERRSTTAEEEG